LQQNPTTTPSLPFFYFFCLFALIWHCDFFFSFFLSSTFLQVTAEADPAKAFLVNDVGQRNILDVAKDFGLRLFAPSSIATFGPTAPLDNTPNVTIQRPMTMYGINKLDLELTGEYFHQRYRDTGFEFRCLRLPGIISAMRKPGGGTTDWANEALNAAAHGQTSYKCWMAPKQRMPFLHIDDAVKAIAQAIFADSSDLSRCVYNLGGLSFSPEELNATIKEFVPGFEFEYIEDEQRQTIAAGWPRSLDGSEATKDFGWTPEITLENLVADMLEAMPQYSGVKPGRKRQVYNPDVARGSRRRPVTVKRAPAAAAAATDAVPDEVTATAEAKRTATAAATK
jgi:threonine 3-dehydrogenase